MSQVKTVLRRMRGRLLPARPVAGPLISVIIPVYNTAQYLQECLDSVLTQADVAVEVVVIDDGSSDESPKILAGYAATDRRVKVLTQTNRGLGAARNTAVQSATGEYLFFIDSDDCLPKKALARMVGAAEKHHADIVMGPLARFNSVRKWVPRWGSELHRSDQYFASLAERPELLRNFYTASKLIRHSFWDAADAAFREGTAYEDQPLVTRLLIAADGIVSLADPVYEWRLRDDQSSTSQQSHTMADLQARALAWRATLDFFDADATAEPIRTAWLDTVYRTHVHWYLDSESVADPTYWAQLREVVTNLPALDRFLPLLPAAKAFSLELLRDDRHAELLRWRAGGAFELAQQRFIVEGAKVFWQPELTAADEAPPRREVAVDSLTLRTEFLQATWTPEGLTIGGRHFLPGLDEAGVVLSHYLEVCDPAGVVVAQVPAEIDPDAAPFGDGHTMLSYPHAHFVAQVPPSALAAAGPVAVLQVRTMVGELAFTDALPAGTRWFAASRLTAAAMAGYWLRPVVDAAGVRVEVADESAWVMDARPVGDGLEVEVGGEIAELALGEGRVRFPVTDGRAVIPRAELDRIARSRGQSQPLTRPDAAGGWVPLRGWVHQPVESLLLATEADAQVVLQAPAAHVEFTDVRYEGSRAAMGLVACAAGGAAVTKVWLKSAKGSIAARQSADGWQLELAGQPDGGYDVWAQLAQRRDPVKVLAAPSYLARVPNVHFVGAQRWRCLVARAGTVHLDARVMPPGPAAAPIMKG